jgi:2-polyprenyl-3-methyl-5-hydroxy-6-metoxy-1,4-benzoquinol methylase
MEIMKATLSSFRDPAGTVEVMPHEVHRRVRSPYDVEIREFLATPLALRLVTEGRLIDSEVIPLDSGPDPLILKHPRVPFQSYPWEWPPSLWLSAAKLTLTFCRELLEESWILKDATPLNILFQGMRPTFVDVLSIRKLESRKPIWYASGQFTRTFLLPMIAYNALGWNLQATIARRDGYEPQEIFPKLPWHKRLKPPALSAVTLPHLLHEKQWLDAIPWQQLETSTEITKNVIRRTLDKLIEATQNVAPSSRISHWSRYAEISNHYGPEDAIRKQSFVSEIINDEKPKQVLDIGCNNGTYSRIAASSGADVVAIDADLESLESLCTNAEGNSERILPLQVDIAHPTPATGWMNLEHNSFLERCHEHFEMIMMLAVVHHILIGSQVPLNHVAFLCKTITKRSLIIEWIPPDDPKFQQILRGRNNLYTHITEAAFRAAFAVHFILLREITLSNGRILLHYQRASYS